jgi:SAM-dependent methyltransferase
VLNACVCCGGSNLTFTKVLWPELIVEWRLSPPEAEIIDRQQGLHCAGCGANLRSMALAQAILTVFGADGTFERFMNGRGKSLAILEINEAGQLTQFLSRAPQHRVVSYPQVDMHALPFRSGSHDLVVHSDTLEHVEFPVAALGECRRVLRAGGACAFTVPLVAGRLTSSRAGLPPSYHLGGPVKDPHVLVRTEYGADAWLHVLQAGFRECRIVPLDFPAATALVGMA